MSLTLWKEFAKGELIEFLGRSNLISCKQASLKNSTMEVIWDSMKKLDELVFPLNWLPFYNIIIKQ